MHHHEEVFLQGGVVVNNLALLEVGLENREKPSSFLAFRVKSRKKYIMIRVGEKNNELEHTTAACE